MKVIVVYESLWGSTAAVARAIAEGFGTDARAMSTADASARALAGADRSSTERRCTASTSHPSKRVNGRVWVTWAPAPPHPTCRTP